MVSCPVITKEPWFPSAVRRAHHLVTVVIRTTLIFEGWPRRVLWQPARKDNTAFVSLAKSCLDYFSTVQNKVGEKHQIFTMGKLPGGFFLSVGVLVVFVFFHQL